MIVLSSHFPHPCPFPLPPVAPPASDRNHKDVEDVKADHEESFPEVNVAVVENAESEEDGDGEESDVSKKSAASDSERGDEGHGPAVTGQCQRSARENAGERDVRDDRDDEARRADKFSNRQAARVILEGSKGREDIGTAVGEGEEGYASLEEEERSAAQPKPRFGGGGEEEKKDVPRSHSTPAGSRCDSSSDRRTLRHRCQQRRRGRRATRP